LLVTDQVEHLFPNSVLSTFAYILSIVLLAVLFAKLAFGLLSRISIFPQAG